MQSYIRAPQIGGQLALAIVFSFSAYQLWPIASYMTEWWQYLWAGILAYLAVVLAIGALSKIIHYHHQEKIRDRSLFVPVSKQGARFANEGEISTRGLFRPDQGIPIGQINGRPLFFAFTHALCLSPAGSGKTVSLALPALSHGYRNKKYKFPANSASTVCVDLKGELVSMSWHLRKNKHGHRVIFIAPGTIKSHAYNFLDLVKDALQGRIPINKALTRAKGLALNLEPEPPGDAKNKYFRDGSRKILTLAILYECITSPDKSNLTTVRRLIMDFKALMEMLEKAKEMDSLNGELALLAKDLLYESKHFDEFRSGASMALEPFSPAGELAHVVSHSDFRWSELKTIPTTVYICANLAEQKVFKSWLAMLTECAMTEISQEKGNIPIHFLLDEATNFAFDISEKLTALRGVGARVQIIAQENSEIQRVFGKHAAETIFNECDLKQFFGISDPVLAKKLSEIMGDKLVVRKSYHSGKKSWDDVGESSNYERVPLMSVQEILNMKPNEQLIFIEGMRPILCQKMAYNEVQPWYNWLKKNPLEGGKLPNLAHIQLRYSKQDVQVTACRKKTRPKGSNDTPKSKPFIPMWLKFTGLWLGVFYVAWHSFV